MRAQFCTVGPLAAANPALLRAAATISGAGPLTLLATSLDTQRRILITVTGAATAVLTLSGNDVDGNAVTENITLAGAGTYQSVLDYLTNIAISSSASTAGTVAIGTNGVASSGWVTLNHWSPGGVAFQINVSGTVNYTVQQTLDDPNNSVNPVLPQNVTWISCSDSAVVGASTAQQSNYQFAPVHARILLNNGTGSASGTFVQNGP